MADQWYYGQGTVKQGPYSTRQLRDLADAGRIQFSDTVWKVGVEAGVPAETIQNLYSPDPNDSPAGAAAPVPVEGPAVANPDTEAKPAPKTPPAPPKKKKLRALAVKGAIIVSQDGESAHYRKKCTICGHEDASKNRMQIRNGMTRTNYFCPKCRRLGGVEIQGLS